MDNKKYTQPEIEITVINSDDVIRTSIELPDDDFTQQ